MSGTLIAHITLMSTMILLVLVAVVGRMIRKPKFFKTHRLLALTGIAAGFAGVVTMFVVKTLNEWPHFNSGHSRTGLVAFWFFVANATAGLLMKRLGRHGRTVHRWFGRVALLVAVVALVRGIASQL